MTEREFNELLEQSWRRPLTPDEDAAMRAWLATHPEAQPAWESEAALNHLLGQLPDAPVASNFTTRVMQALDREAARPAHAAPWQVLKTWWLRKPLPRLAWAAAIVAVGVVLVQTYRPQGNRELAQKLVTVTTASGLKEPTVFQDFDAIQQMAQVPPAADEVLWMALTQEPGQ